jgi:hypothetical protein
MELITKRFGVQKEILLMPVGDIQWAGDRSEVALGMLKRHIQWGVDRGAYFIGMGDYIDTFSPSNRAKLTSAQLYDTALRTIDKDAYDRMKELYDQALAPSKGRWLGLLEGHHFHQMRTGLTTDQYLAELLDAPFLGTSAYLRLIFDRAQTAKPSTGEVVIWLHHGTGSSRAVGGALARLDQVRRGFDADIYMMGHFHSKDAKPIDYIRPIFPAHGLPRLVHATRLLVVTGSFLKGHVAHRRDGLVPRGGYVEQSMLNPVSLGGVLVKIRPRWQTVTAERPGKAPREYRQWNPDFGVEL